MIASTERQRVLSVLGADLVGRTARVLSAQGIELMPLKGVVLQTLVYADPAERPISDVDVLVRPRDHARATAVLAAEGYSQRFPGPRGTATVYRAPHVAIDLDLHQRLFRPALFRLSTEAVFARATRDDATFGAPVALPDPLDLYAHLVGHFAKGRHGPDDVMHLRDLAAVAERYDLAPERVAAHLARVGVARAARYTLAMAERVCGDAHARAVIDALPRDRLGDALGRAALRRLSGPGRYRALLMHALNDTTPRAIASLAMHGLEIALRPVSR